MHDRAQDRETVRAAGAATALLLENQRLDAELRARLVELGASRARLVQAADAERRRLERNLHDGAQSRLVALALTLRLARMSVADGSDTAALLDTSIDELKHSLDELRDLARGIHPAVLSDRGLEPAVRALAARAPVPVEIVGGSRRPPPRCGGDRRLLRRVRGAHQRVEVRARRARDGPGGARRRTAARGGERRRRGRRQRRRRLRAPRASPTASPPSAARWRSRARPATGPACEHTCPARDAADAGPASRRRGRGLVPLPRGHRARARSRPASPWWARPATPTSSSNRCASTGRDVVVTDIRMPPTNTDEGVRAAALIRAELPQTGVLVLSQYVNESYALRLLGDSAAGVGYLLKQRVMEPRGFVEAVRQVARGGSALDPEVVAQMLDRRRPGGPLDELSARELAALAGMAEGRSNLAIADRSRHRRARPAAPHHSRLQQARPARRRRGASPRAGRPHLPPRAGDLRQRPRERLLGAAEPRERLAPPALGARDLVERVEVEAGDRGRPGPRASARARAAAGRA